MAKSRYLAGAAGAALLAAAIAYTSGWEGTRYTAYQDVGGVWTICQGLTGPWVHRGLTLSEAECDKRFAGEIVSHERALLACAPELRDAPGKTYIAIQDWAFNAGPNCRSTLVGLVRAGKLRAACEQLPRWVYVNKRVVSGLVNRRWRGTPGRISERDLCLQGLEGGQ